MKVNEILEKVNFYGNFIMYSNHIYAHAILLDDTECSLNNSSRFIALYNPKKDELMFFSETDKSKLLIEITETEKTIILENMKKAYFDKYGRDIISVWRELSKLQNEMYA